eukprot:Plantae.Rhodophyta-Hildenbrandia_rubra.ctg18152.p3 GENE.Plantae.Rhodophyta-Hildenbrandia_rubra.ctg18152~~Plantae.Rhodophyta-Hildenbrandia_rubra.ctg18152.p3  ORF type:complete len:238 (+),score=63.63 Plantae.Rhodophyta-Hildenbrandia_rubra.ctg18152:2612-3325(+)
MEETTSRPDPPENEADNIPLVAPSVSVGPVILETPRRIVPIAPSVTGEDEVSFLTQKRALENGESLTQPSVDTVTTVVTAGFEDVGSIVAIPTQQSKKKKRKKDSGVQPPEGLSAEEKAKWKRMLRNRESAARSRDRKKRKNLELEKSIERTNKDYETLEKLRNEAIELLGKLQDAGFVEKEDVSGDVLMMQGGIQGHSEPLGVASETDSQPNYLKTDANNVFGAADAIESTKDGTS